MTMAAGVGALEDDEYFKDNCRKIIQTREWTTQQLVSLGFTVVPSSANFVFAKHPKMEGKALYEQLKANGILVRYFDKDRLREYNRITIGDQAQMQTLIATLKQLLEG